MVIQTALFTRDYNYRVVYVLRAFLIFIFGHFLTVNNPRYGRCYVKNYTTVYVPCILHSSRGKLSKIAWKCFLQVLKDFKYCLFFFFLNRIFDKCRHFSAYRATFSNKSSVVFKWKLMFSPRTLSIRFWYWNVGKGKKNSTGTGNVFCQFLLKTAFMDSQFYVQHLTDPSKRNWSGNLNINFFATVDRIISELSTLLWLWDGSFPSRKRA